MRNFIGWICFTLIAATGSCLDPIGTVVAVDGVLKAMDADKNTRVLDPGGNVFLGDTLITDHSAKGQVQFLDGTLILLIPGSRYSVDAYAEGNKFTSKLSKGGVRISTGLIAKKNPENFEVHTANATIGVRGTVFESRLYQGDLYVGSSSGNLDISNQGGNLAIGADEPNQFASVTSSRKAPKPLAERPSALNLSNFEPPTGGLSFANAPVGSAAAAGQAASTGGFAWGPGIGAAVVIGAMVGVIAGTAAQSQTQSQPTFAH